jgi:hypothetical protein
MCLSLQLLVGFDQSSQQLKSKTGDWVAYIPSQCSSRLVVEAGGFGKYEENKVCSPEDKATE